MTFVKIDRGRSTPTVEKNLAPDRCRIRNLVTNRSPPRRRQSPNGLSPGRRLQIQTRWQLPHTGFHGGTKQDQDEHFCIISNSETRLKNVQR